MRNFIDALRTLTLARPTVEREIAPGVRVQIRPMPRTLKLADRMHDALDAMLHPRAQKPDVLQDRLHTPRRAA